MQSLKMCALSNECKLKTICLFKVNSDVKTTTMPICLFFAMSSKSIYKRTSPQTCWGRSSIQCFCSHPEIVH